MDPMGLEFVSCFAGFCFCQIWGSTLVWENPVDVWKIPTGFYGWKNMFFGNPPNIPNHPKGILGFQTNGPQTNKVVAGFTYFLNVHPENLGKIRFPFWGLHILSNWVGLVNNHQLEDTLRKKQKKNGRTEHSFGWLRKTLWPMWVEPVWKFTMSQFGQKIELGGFRNGKNAKISHMLPILIMLPFESISRYF